MGSFKECYVDFTKQPIPNMHAQTTDAVPTAADNQVDYFYVNGHYFELIQQAANSDIFFTRNSSAPTGWIVPNDNSDNEGIEITQGISATETLNYLCYTVGTDPAFRLDVKFRVPDVSDYDVMFVGFRKAAAYTTVVNTAAALVTAYTDIGGLNLNAGSVYSNTRLNSATGVQTDTTNTVADATSVTFSTLVSSAGVCTFLVDGAAPTVNTNTLTFDTDDVLIPTIIITKGGTAADTPPILETYSCKFQ